MKTNHFKQLGYLLLSLIFFISCNKESKELSIDNLANCQNNKNECRLLSVTSEFGDQTYTYNRKGLVDQTNIDSYDGYFKMEYNALGRLIKSRYYSGGELVNTIVFGYQYDRVVKETWYDGNTKIKSDEIFYTYNWRGNLTKAKSIIGDYNSVYKYSPDGNNVVQYDLYFGGIINYTQLLTYLAPHHKNPFLATPGISNGFPFINGGISDSKWYSTSEKDIAYDGNGMNPEVVIDQDPARSIVKFNGHNYVTATDYFDNVSQEYSHFKFMYGNCGNDNGDNTNSSKSQLGVPSTRINPLSLLRLGSAKSIKDQLKEIRSHSLSR